MKKGRWKWIWIVAVLLVLAVAGTLLLGGKQTERYAEATASTGNLNTYYTFSGTLEVNHSLTVTAPTATTVSEVYVRANGTVVKNARLMRMEDGSVLKADIGGEVTSLSVTTGSVVRAGDTLAEIMDLSDMKVDFDVDEYDVSAITLGKDVQMTLDGSGSVFNGAISALNKRATQDKAGDLSYFTATVDLAGVQLPPEALPGMQVTVRVQNRSTENVVLLPMDALSFTAQNEPYVLVQNGKEVARMDVQVGINDGINVEITAGLRGGDVVLYTPTATDALQKMMQNRDQAISKRFDDYAN
ncbi:MAG: HlyD family efflux transporter periplasmic adaptor subunit [Candidatus Limiplasma sp.]|nr:HlyD family efflux transporter periplasmic adaptor subunit [Candidatus Limiplasma sp.]